MATVSVYTFKAAPDEGGTDYETTDFTEAKEYAQRNNYAIIDNVYEWTEAVPVEGCDYREAPHGRCSLCGNPLTEDEVDGDDEPIETTDDDGALCAECAENHPNG